MVVVMAIYMLIISREDTFPVQIFTFPTQNIVETFLLGVKSDFLSMLLPDLTSKVCWPVVYSLLGHLFLITEAFRDIETY